GTVATQAGERAPLHGPVVAGDPAYRPMALVRAMLLRALAGNAVIAGPAGGSCAACTGLAAALSVREGLPLTLLSGVDREAASGQIRAHGPYGPNDPYFSDDLTDAPGLSDSPGGCWGVWDSADRDALPALLGGRSAAWPRPGTGTRWVVRRSLLSAFLEAYLPAVRAARFGHPLAVASPQDPLPDLDFGPLRSAAAAGELAAAVRDALDRGAEPLHQGALADGHLLPGQDTSAYLAPTALLCPPALAADVRTVRGGGVYGPVDWVVPVETEAELLAETADGRRTAEGAPQRTAAPNSVPNSVPNFAHSDRTSDERPDGPEEPRPRGQGSGRAVTCAPALRGKESDSRRRRPDQPPERAA
ncbi:aldehyde dehydrogenase family protein, partial [Streptomyces nanshensis]|uniref:aldehyde dehydrogenase family protein n=1 Tax=Streptomyces nanshensis TaxID=518642 RepID=UPI00114CEB1C